MSHVHHETGDPRYRSVFARADVDGDGFVEPTEVPSLKMSSADSATSKTWHLLTKKYYKVTQSIEWAWSWCFSSFEISPLRVPGSVSRPELSWWNPTCRRSNKQIISNSASRILWCKMWYEVSQRSRTGFPKQDELAQIYTLADVDKELSALLDF